jgi:hypothetical protein
LDELVCGAVEVLALAAVVLEVEVREPGDVRPLAVAPFPVALPVAEVTTW